MAGSSSFSVLLKVLGESSSAVSAVTKVASSLNNLGNAIQATSKKADGLGANLQQSASRAQGQFNKIVAAAKQAGAAVKAAFSGVAGKVNAPSINLGAFSRLAPIVQKIKDALSRAAGGVSAFAGSLGKVGGPADKLQLLIFKATDATQQLTAKVAAFAPVAVSAFGRAASSVASFAGNLVKGVSSKIGGVMNGIFGSDGGLKKFAAGLEVVRRNFINLNDGVRIAAQGITNLGRAMFFFFSIPVAAFFSNAIRGAIDFEDAMVRVAKTANLTDQQLTDVSDGIRKIATQSATSHVELAGIAEVVGQLGVQSPEAISNLTRVFDVFAKSTGQVGETVATQLGRIAAAFGRELGTSQEWVWRLANTINTLENETAATASEIQTALTDFAPFANVLKLTAAEASGLTATLISLGLSPDETGTALRNLSEYIVANAEDVSKLMGTYKEAYGTVDGLLNALETDALAVFMDMSEALASSSTPLQSMVDILDVLEKRGGRSIVLLAQNLDMLKANLDSANTSWEEAKGLIEEYERAMQSTKSQMGLLRNNIQEAGIVLGEALLPVINELVSVAVPAIQKLAEWFKSLSRSQQLNIVMWGAIALAAGPVLMLFGQIVHGISLVVLGFGQFIKVITGIIGAIQMFGPAVMGAVSVITSVPGLIIIGFVGVLKVLSKLGVDISGMFKKLGAAAKSWGENLAANLANGLLAGAVRYITQAINYIANLISSFFESHSPPKKGPLSTIDKWGLGLMNAFMKGFSAADFGVLEDISSTIETILTSGLQDEALIGGLKKLASARVSLAELIDNFNKTGVIDEGMLDKVTSGLGDMTGKVKELIRLQLRYNDIQERLAAIEQRRKQINDVYDDEIAAIGASNMSVAEKIDAIRAAGRARADANSGLDEEEESLQEQADLIAEQLDAQKGLIDALNKQKNIFQQIADILKGMADDKAGGADAGLDAGGLGGGGGGMGDFGGLGEGLTEGLDESLGEAQEKMQGFFDKLNTIISFEEGKKKLQGFLDGLNGVEPAMESAFDSTAAYETYQVMYKLGQTVGMLRDKFFQLRDTAVQVWGNIQKVFKGGGKSGFLDSLKASPAMQKLSSVLGNIFSIIQRVGSVLRSVFLPVWVSLQAQFSALQPTFAQLGEAFSNLWQSIQPLLPVLGAVAKILGGTLLVMIGAAISALAGFAAGIAQFVTATISAVAQVVSGIVNTLSGIISFVSGFVQVIYGLVTGSSDAVSAGLQKMSTGITQMIQGAVQALNGFINFLVTGVIGGVMSFVSTFLSTFVGMWDAFTGQTHTWATDFQNIVQAALGTVGTIFTEMIPQWISYGTDLVQGFLDGITQKWSELYTLVKGKIDEFVASVKASLGIASPSVIFMQMGIDLIQGLINGVTSMLGAVTSAIQSVASTILDTIKSIFSGKQQKGGGFDINSILPDEGDVKKRTSAIEKTIDAFAKGIVKSVEGAGKDIVKSWESTWDGLEKAVDPAQKAVDSFASDVQKTMSDAGRKIDSDWDRTWSGLGRTVTSATNSVKSAINSLSSTVTSAVNTMRSRLSSLTSSFTSLRSSVTTAAGSVNSLVTAVSRISNSTVQGLAAAFNITRSSISSALTALNSFISRLSALQNTTIRVNVVASGSGASWSGSGSQTTTTWTGTGSVSPRASGGYAAVGQAYMVGELGPELFIPSQGGSVIPNYLLRRMVTSGPESGSGGIQININGPVVREDADIRRIAEMVARELAATMNGRNRFGGTIRT